MPLHHRLIATSVSAILAATGLIAAPAAGAAPGQTRETGGQEQVESNTTALTEQAVQRHDGRPRSAAELGAGRPTGRVLVELAATPTTTARTALARSVDGAVAERRGPVLALEVADVDAALAELSAREDVLRVSRERFLALQGEENTDVLTETGVAQARATDPTFTGAGVTVAVIDSGVDATNRDLAGRVVAGGRAACAPSATAPTDWHGTAVAAAVAGDDDGDAVTGTAPQATILAYNVFCEYGGDIFANEWDVQDAVRDAVDRGAKVINLSLGSPFNSWIINDAIDYAVASNALVVVAAGNDGSEQPNFPAGSRRALSVGATVRNGSGGWMRAYWSTWGAVDVVAPGDMAGWYRNSTGQWELQRIYGTSFAAPIVSGIAAGLVQRGARPYAVRALLAATAKARKVDYTAPGAAQGHGPINAATALQVWKDKKPFSAVLPFEGTTVTAGTLEQQYRELEVIRYDPDGDATASPNSTAVVTRSWGATPALRDLRTPYRCGNACGIPTAADSRGGKLREGRWYVAPNRLTEGATFTLSSKYTGDVHTSLAMAVMHHRNGPEAPYVASGQKLSRTLNQGWDSVLVGQFGGYAGETISIPYSAPAYALANGRALLCLWRQWDGDGDGYVGGAASNDLEPNATDVPWRCLGDLSSESLNRTGTWKVWLPRIDTGMVDSQGRKIYDDTANYLVGFRVMDPSGDGAYSVTPAFRTPTAEVVLPEVSLPRNDLLPVRWRTTSLAGRTEAVQIQWAKRVKDAAGTWRTSAWGNIGYGRGYSGASGDEQVRSTPGTTYLFRARAFDTLGNVGRWGAVRRTDVPLDQGAYAVKWSGQWNDIGCPYFAGTSACYRDGARGASGWYAYRTFTATLTTDATRFGILGATCPRCGTIKVYVDGTLRATVDLRRSTTTYQRWLWTSQRLSWTPRKRTLKIVGTTTPAREKVIIDGIRISR